MTGLFVSVDLREIVNAESSVHELVSHLAEGVQTVVFAEKARGVEKPTFVGEIAPVFVKHLSQCPWRGPITAVHLCFVVLLKMVENFVVHASKPGYSLHHILNGLIIGHPTLKFVLYREKIGCLRVIDSPVFDFTRYRRIKSPVYGERHKSSRHIVRINDRGPYQQKKRGPSEPSQEWTDTVGTKSDRMFQKNSLTNKSRGHTTEHASQTASAPQPLISLPGVRVAVALFGGHAQSPTKAFPGGVGCE